MRLKKKKKPVEEAINYTSHEFGTIYKDAPFRCVLIYPSPYKVALSSLGFQVIYRLLNSMDGVCCERAVLDHPKSSTPLRTIERRNHVNNADLIGLSVATEEEVAYAALALLQSGIPPLEKERRKDRNNYPLVIAGGPLSYADAHPLCAIADVVLCGEAEDSLFKLIEICLDCPESYDSLFDDIAELPGVLVADGDRYQDIEGTFQLPVASPKWIPAHSVITTPLTEFGDMFLIEPARGCPRKCSFCVMEKQKFRIFSPEIVLSHIPNHANRIGLVGSAIMDHPRINEIISTLVGEGKNVSLSSLRADRLKKETVELLVQGGARSLTIAADGSSERLRKMVRKGVTAPTLLEATEKAARYGLKSVKLYSMIGLPTEEDDDIKEFCDLVIQMSHILPLRVALSSFVPKARTTFAHAPFTSPALLQQRLSLIRQTIGHRVKMSASSIRGAIIENAVARGGIQAGEAAVKVAQMGCTYNAWKHALQSFQLIS